MNSTNKNLRVWDLPIRLFHWTLTILVTVSIYTGLKGGFQEMDYHMLSGYAILALLFFRVCWGVIGSNTARFSQFIAIRKIVPYTRQLLGRDSSSGKTTIGHNPLGALSVIALLTVLFIQATTGLFSDDDIMTEGPLTHLVSEEVGDQLTAIHHLNSRLLYGLVGLHLVAIFFYEIYRRDRLITPMINGRKSLELPMKACENLAAYSIPKALLAVSFCFGLTYYLINKI